MKVALRCLYHKPVTPNFLIVDLPDEIWPKFNWADKYERIRIIQPFIRKPYPSIREIAWIPLKGLKDSEMMELEMACKELMSEEYKGLQFNDNEDEK